MASVHRSAFVTLVVVGLLIAPTAAMTVEEVIERHVAAHGGIEKFDAIRTLKISGEYQAFSVVAPFTLLREKDDRYHLDLVMNENPVVIGHDGETLWWDNSWRGAGARELTEPDRGVWIRETEFLTPFFHYADKGYGVELVGETDFEGIPAIGIKVIRPDEGDETWFLDPDTYLAIARVSPGSDFGRPLPQRTVYDDYREVDGVLIPYFVETQWYTRDRVMRIVNVETNTEIDPAVFAMPAPIGMGPFRDLGGEWVIALQQRQQPGADWNDSERTISIEPLMGGQMFRETYTTEQGSEVIRTLSYDKHREVYRMTQFSSDSGYMEIRTGEIDEESGRLTLSNLETGTANPQFFARMIIFDIEKNSFLVEHEASIDGGENWFVFAKGAYRRAGDGS